MAEPLFDEMIKRATDSYVADHPQEPAPPEKPEKKDRMIGAHLAWLGPLAADIASTAYAQSHPELQLTERNPLVNWAPTKAQLPIGGAIEAVAYFLGNKYLKKDHPKWFKAALYGAGALHGKAAIHNVKRIKENRAYLKEQGLDGLKFKDGYYYDPNAFIGGDK